MFVIDLRNTTIRNYTFSVIDNKNVDTVYFYSRYTQYANKKVYVKAISEHYADKIRIASEDVQIKNGCLVAKWTMGAGATLAKKLQVQLQFEDTPNELIDQSMIVTISLADSLDPLREIDPIYPTVLQQMQEAIDTLEAESVASIDASCSNGVLYIDWYNAGGQHLGTQLQIELPTEECYVNAVWDANTHKITLTKNNGQTTELDLSDIYEKIATVQGNLDTHTGNKNNPHEVTKAQVGLGNADNTSDADKPVSTAQQQALDLKANKSTVDNHIADTNNPHGVTASQVGLGSVVNTGDSDTPVENGTTKFTTGGAYTELNKKVDKEQGKGLSTNDFTDTLKTKLDNIEAGAQVNIIETVKVNNEALTPSSKSINIDLTSYAKIVDMETYGKSLTVSIDSSTYVMTFTLKDKNGNTLNTQTVDLPLETMVVSGSYDSVNKAIILTLKNGETITIPVADLISGLVSETQLATTLQSYYTKTETDTLLGQKQDTIDSNHKLASDLVDDTNQTNKFVTQADKTKLSGIEAGAEVNNIVGVQVNGLDLTPDANRKVNVDLSHYVTLDTEQTITAKKIFQSNEQNTVEVRQGSSANKVGIQLTNKSGVEMGFFQYNGQTGKTVFGCAETSTNQLAFRSYVNGHAYNVNVPKGANKDSAIGTGDVDLPLAISFCGTIYKANTGGLITLPNPVQDLTTSALATLSNADWLELRAFGIYQYAVSLSGVDSNYDFIRVKLSINSTNYSVVLTKNDTNKYEGEFSIDELTALRKVGLVFNGSSTLIMTCQSIDKVPSDPLLDANGNLLFGSDNSLLTTTEV